MDDREINGLAAVLVVHMDSAPDSLQRLTRFQGTKRLVQAPELIAIELFATIDHGEVKAMWAMNTNPVMSLPNSYAVSQAPAACPLVIVSDIAARVDTGHFVHIRSPTLA